MIGFVFAVVFWVSYFRGKKKSALPPLAHDHTLELVSLESHFHAPPTAANHRKRNLKTQLTPQKGENEPRVKTADGWPTASKKETAIPTEGTRPWQQVIHKRRACSG